MNHRMQNLSSRLTQADLVSPLGYGAGISVLRPWGHQTVARLVQLFRNCLADVVLGQWHEWDPDLLVDEATYDAQVGGVGGFDNVFRLEHGGRRWVLRPDAAVDGLQRALTVSRRGPVGTAFCVYAAYRDLRGSCTPIWRDRAIWPVIQLDIVAPRNHAEAVEAAVSTGLDRFFRTLGLPTLRVDMGQWKGYARRRLDWVLATERAAPTVLAMAYTVGDHYRSMNEIPEDCEAFDVGLTAKPLATLVQLVADGDRLVLPRAIAPVEVVAAGPEPSMLPVSNTLRLAHVDSRTRNWERRWAYRGVPVLLRYDTVGRAEQMVANRGWEPFDPESSVDSLVSEACRGAAAAVAPTRLVEDDDPARFAALCDPCAATHVLHATVVPSVEARCERCGGWGRLRLNADVDQIY